MFQAQFLQGEINFKNGETKKGFVDNPKPDDKHIKFKTTKDSGVEKFESRNVSRINLISEKGVPFTLDNIMPDKGKKEALMLLLIQGKVNLYKIGVIDGQVGYMYTLYAKRANEEKALMCNGMGAKKRMAEYFKDDEETVRYINETPLLDLDIEHLVKIYNRNKGA